MKKIKNAKIIMSLYELNSGFRIRLKKKDEWISFRNAKFP
jgi:hypothetical protein